MRDVQNKKNIYRICFISFIIINIGLIWFYIKSEAQYQPGIHGIEFLIPYLWFSMAMLGAVGRSCDILLSFEISENTMLDGRGMLISFVQKLKDMGFSCSMDDFGSGYSSLNMLKSIPISTIKLDGKMFAEQEKERGKIVSKGIIRIARELNIEVVAEGVETREYVDFLKEQKCDMI